MEAASNYPRDIHKHCMDMQGQNWKSQSSAGLGWRPREEGKVQHVNTLPFSHLFQVYKESAILCHKTDEAHLSVPPLFQV